MHQYDYPRPAVAVDLVLFGLVAGRLAVLRGTRAVPPSQWQYSLPGTFVHENEDAEAACARKIKAIGLDHTFLEQLYTFTDPKRDSRDRVVSIAHYGLIAATDSAPAGDDKISRLAWVDAEVALTEPWAFDHGQIARMAVERLRAKIQYAAISYHFLHEPFTLSELWRTYKSILGRDINFSNFRRDLLRRKLVTAVGRRKVAGPVARTYIWNTHHQGDFFLSLG
jgi:8-oxo-dGTP diphosphatase